MSANRNANLVWAGIIIAVIILADQVTKLWAVSALTGGPSVSVWGEFFMLTLVYNQGGALGTSFGSPTYYLIASPLILLFVLYYIYSHAHIRTIALALAFVAGGAIGNIIDRIRLGYVIDFLDFDFFDISLGGWRIERWWAFNIADAAISCAIVFLIVWLLTAGRPKEYASEQTPPVEAEQI
ncbi:MAG: signal peptidase II [bacterium]